MADPPPHGAVRSPARSVSRRQLLLDDRRRPDQLRPLGELILGHGAQDIDPPGFDRLPYAVTCANWLIIPEVYI
jgi:hypothetical protein